MRMLRKFMVDILAIPDLEAKSAVESVAWHPSHERVGTRLTRGWSTWPISGLALP